VIHVQTTSSHGNKSHTKKRSGSVEMRAVALLAAACGITIDCTCRTLLQSVLPAAAAGVQRCSSGASSSRCRCNGGSSSSTPASSAHSVASVSASHLEQQQDDNMQEPPTATTAPFQPDEGAGGTLSFFDDSSELQHLQRPTIMSAVYPAAAATAAAWPSVTGTGSSSSASPAEAPVATATLLEAARQVAAALAARPQDKPEAFGWRKSTWRDIEELDMIKRRQLEVRVFGWG